MLPTSQARARRLIPGQIATAMAQFTGARARRRRHAATSHRGASAFRRGRQCALRLGRSHRQSAAVLRAPIRRPAIAWSVTLAEK